MNTIQLPAPSLSDYHAYPPHLLESWDTIKRISKHNYPRAMRMAWAWAIEFSEWEKNL